VPFIIRKGHKRVLKATLNAEWNNLMLVGFTILPYTTFDVNSFEFGGADIHLWRAIGKNLNLKLSFELAEDSYSMTNQV